MKMICYSIACTILEYNYQEVERYYCYNLSKDMPLKEFHPS